MASFALMHGLGNRFAIFDGFRGGDELLAIDAAELTRALCAHESGLGLDGVIVVDADPEGEVALRMRIWNADGSDGVMCGNGLRCVGRLARDRAHVEEDEFRVRTGSGAVGVRVGQEDVAVEMGTPRFGLDEIPSDASRLEVLRVLESSAHVVRVVGHEGVLVNVGNPHCVICGDVGGRGGDVASFGESLEHHEAFPERINVQVMQVVGRTRIMLRSWERGVGVTDACATGACAAVVAGVSMGLVDRECRVHMTGGELQVSWDESSGRITQRGSAVLERESVELGDYWKGAGV
ncbi:MAG: diaminopimelate epimerase [Planctomycetota bacterium]|jgi:diaminopimelate epimerase